MAIVIFYVSLTIFFLGFFGNSLFDYGILPRPFAVFTEISIALLFLISVLWRASTKTKYHIHFFFVLFFLGETLISMTATGTWSMAPIYSLRNLLRFYVLYLAYTNLPISDELIKKVNKYILMFLILQLPVAAIKFAYYGLSEITMGAYAVHEGSLTTMIPTVVIIYFLAYYHYGNKNKLYLLLTAAFVAYAIIGKKRAIVFFIPASLFFTHYLIFWKGSLRPLSKRLLNAVGISVLAVLLALSIISINPTLNPEHRIGGKIDLDYFFAFVRHYTTSTDSLGNSTGRTSTTIRVITDLSTSGLYTFLFGFGPGKITASILDPQRKIIVSKFLLNKLRVRYGLTPFTAVSVEYGIVGGLLFCSLLTWFIIQNRRHFCLENEPYWKALSLGNYGFSVFMLFFYFFYHPPALLGDTLPLGYFYVMATSRWRIQKLRSASPRS